jgi:gliding motility-associated-like protein
MEKHFPFEENKGQWKEDFYYKLKLRWGNIYFSKDKITTETWDQVAKKEILHSLHDRLIDSKALKSPLKQHAFEVKFLNSSPNCEVSSISPSQDYSNYYIGNDPNRWKSKVYSYASINYSNVWQSINVKYYTNEGFLKYDILLEKGADPTLIQLQYNGQEKLKIKNNVLTITTSVGEIDELAPFAYQVINGKRVIVPCKYQLKKNILGYELGEYNKNYPLVIDPQIIFSTYSGSTGDNWGATATYDTLGNGFAGGINFQTGYPTTIGAYQTNFGGNSDVSITKYNPTGTARIYATYFGGSHGELPYSMVVDQWGNLLVTGVTGSSGLPTTTGAYDATFNGGTSFGLWGNGSQINPYLSNYPNGSDFFLAKFSPDGSQLLASTYLGGSENDGFNYSTALNKNYGDMHRGEVIVDLAGDVFVIGTTRSTDIATLNAWQPDYGGGSQDGVVFKLNPQLTNMLSCSYVGGNGDDAGYGMQLSASNEIYFCGGSNSPSINGFNGLHATNTGNVDGFIIRADPNSGNIIAGSFLGTSSYDQAYFVQVDNNGDVIVLGQSQGNYPIQSNLGNPIYSVPGGMLFFHKLNPNLNQSIWSTTYGAPGNPSFIVPSAFLIDYCGFISFSVWAGNVNEPLSSTTLGLPVTPDAFQSASTGSDFYLGVLTEDAASLHYATFFGGAQDNEHVDGGTSRFDKNGVVYQCVCSGCGPTANDLPITPGVWSATNNSNNCNAALFKFDLSEFSAIVNEAVQSNFCLNQAVQFQNFSTGTNQFLWDFGDGNTSTETSPSHGYSVPGIYTVMLIAIGDGLCVQADTAYTQVEVSSVLNLSFTPPPTICQGESIQLQTQGAEQYFWMLTGGLSPAEQTIPNPTVNPSLTTVYTVIGSNNCGSDTAFINVPVVSFNVQLTVSENEICEGNSVTITSSPAVTYQWQPVANVSNPSAQNTIFTPSQSGYVSLFATDPNNCISRDSVFIEVVNFPAATAPNDTLICLGDELILNYNTANTIVWTNLQNNISYNGNPFIINPTQSGSYLLTVSNVCGIALDTTQVDISTVIPIAGPEKTVCINEPVVVFATGGVNYSWLPASDFSSPTNSTSTLVPRENITYSVIVENSFGCKEIAQLPITLFPIGFVSAGEDKVIQFGESTSLSGTSSVGTIVWKPDYKLSCLDCLQPLSKTDSTIKYTISLTDTFGCKYSDETLVLVEGSLYIPNAFTPNGDGINDFFGSEAIDVTKYSLKIFNRWGEIIFTSNNLKNAWDGTFKGKTVQNDVYVYQLNYEFNTGKTGNVVGRVTLIQ